MAPTTLIPGFDAADLDIGEGVRIRAATGGSGPPLLLLHGHPQTHATWRAVAPALAERFTVVATDLRGYGDSAKPGSGGDHAPYSKRAMAADQVAVMRELGHERFAVVGHDRGGRVAHRMALDRPDAVERLAVLDIAPTATMYARADREFATRYFWWFFLIQPEPLPEEMIAGATETYLRAHLRGQSGTGGVPEEELVQEYLRCYRDPRTVHAVCEDYRAAAGIDLAHDAEDAAAGRHLTQPLLALWGTEGTVGRTYDVLGTWREVSAGSVDGHALPCGHLVQEETPRQVTEALTDFLTAPTPR
ncbi:alpha/beta fold hydrolase [Streptomonospora wellingtoniae]|uniref:Alpha/beta hydrolase n=1 Tax=Streptomonospora wellingtoniae TaxID=3075544 RepID=A0ABU2KQ83_9ACTN|nr:alpha/beta hydrolase [Streptomonospora sp. DSM 45055]MDT0301429.1 alpha/beta hydrolase [Streptomonospora sp. DSM 45055]